MELFAQILGQGKPLIIMHGLFGMSDNWQTLGRKWSGEYEVHLLDLRNHGRSPHSRDFSYEAMSDDLLEYMDKQHIEKACILGHSMGGKVAMFFAALNPDRVEKMIVADIAPRAYKPHHQEILDALHAVDLQNMGSRSEVDENFKIEDPGTKQFLLKSLYWKEKKQLAWRFNLSAISEEIEKVGEALPERAIFYGPALFIRGGSSSYIGDKDMEDIETHFPEGNLKTIEGAGHWLHAEKPKDFFEVADDFLGQ